MIWWYRIKLYHFSKFINVNLCVGRYFNRVNGKITSYLNDKESRLNFTRRTLSEKMNKNLHNYQCFNSIFHCLCLLMKCFSIYMCRELPWNGLLYHWLDLLVVEFSIFFWNEQLRVVDDAENGVSFLAHRDYKWVREVNENLYRLIVPFLQLKGIFYVIWIDVTFKDEFQTDDLRYINCINGQKLSTLGVVLSTTNETGY